VPAPAVGMSDEVLTAAIEAVTWRHSPGWPGVEPHDYCLFREAPDLHRAVSGRLRKATRDPAAFSRRYNGNLYWYLPVGDWVLWKIKEILNRRPREAGE
jgi:hypothetical protein